MRRLKRRHGPTHIPLTQIQNLIHHLLLLLRIFKLTPFHVGNVFDPLSHAFDRQRCEAELGASTRQRLDDAGDVIADEDEASDAAVGLDDATEGRLGVAGNGVGFVEDDDFEGWIGMRFFDRFFIVGVIGIINVHFILVIIFLGLLFFGGKEICLLAGSVLIAAAIARSANGQTGEVLNLISHDANAPLVTGIQLQHTSFELGRLEQLTTQRQCHGGFAGPGRAVEEEMGEAIRLDGVGEGGDDFGLVGDVGEGFGAVFFDPGGGAGCGGGGRGHG
mmetsp:Transcript_9381/g.20316  ORF Transcript_9381/g.20316 Transcript_9381/m.20316 type:complete len:276 (+) Transcript_9381:595-1422(+)